MSAKSDLKDIENFNQIYYERLRDLMILHSSIKNTNVICMHIGGIVIECFLKSLIVKKYNIIKRKGNWYWYDISTTKELINQGNVTTDEYDSKKTIKNPGHSFREALEAIGLENDPPDRIVEGLNYIYQPLGSFDFIDLRYCIEEDVTDEEYKKWFGYFQDCRNWIDKHKDKIKGG